MSHGGVRRVARLRPIYSDYTQRGIEVHACSEIETVGNVHGGHSARDSQCMSVGGDLGLMSDNSATR